MTPQPYPLRVVFLGSGSSGNAAAITDGVTTVLLDCGFSAREVARRLSACGIPATSVSALLVTHEHTDHVRGVDVFVRRHAPGCTIYTTRGTRRAAGLGGGDTVVEEVRPGVGLRIGTLDVVAFRVSHDAAQPVGFRFESADSSAGIVTDTGVLTPEAAEALTGVHTLGIESNHDIGMLDNGPYPPFLKRRIRSEHGHLSNADAADAIERLASDGLRQVFALHRSSTNNTASLAVAALRNRLTRLGLDVPVSVASQVEPCDSAPPQTALSS